MNQLREAQAAADRSDERARRAEAAVEEVSAAYPSRALARAATRQTWLRPSCSARAASE